MKTKTLKEVSKKINIPQGTLRQWEKDFYPFLVIPRTKQGARIYSEMEIEQLLEIKQMAEEKFSKDMILETLQKKLEPQAVNEIESTVVSLEVISNTAAPAVIDENPLNNADLFFEAMDAYKQNFLHEVKEEIRSVVRKEVLEEVKKEIKNGTYTTVKTLQDSIYKSTENTKSEIQELSESLDQVSERTIESLQYLSNNIANVSMETTEEIFTLSKQLSETTEELSNYVDVTNHEISNLTEAISKDREFFVEERDQYRHDLTQRELAFQQMLNSFRDVAVTKEKKWWKFWSN